MSEKYERIDMSFEEFCNARQLGWLDLKQIISGFSVNSREVMGNSDKTKNWISFNGDNFLYKGINCNKAESAGYAYAELIVEELAKKLELPAAFYDLARYGDERGIVTRNVVEKENQDMHSLSSLLEEDKDVNDLEELIDNMVQVLEQQGVAPEDIESIKKEFVQRRIFDLFIMATDTHTENISLIFELDENGKKRARLAPIYDSESSLFLDCTESQMEFINRPSVHHLSKKYLDTIEPTLSYGENWKEQLLYLSDLEGGQEFIKKCSERLDISEAIRSVETKINSPVPDVIKNFVGFVFDSRKSTIDNTMQRHEIGDMYCTQIGEMSQKVSIKDFTRVLYAVFDGITPEAEKMIKKLEEMR